MVEVTMGVADGYGVGDVRHHPLHSADSRIDNDLFAIDRNDVAVGLIVTHRFSFYLHFTSISVVYRMQFYQELETILQIAQPDEKMERFRDFYDAYRSGEVDFTSESTPKIFDSPSYASFCHVVLPKKVPKRNNLTTEEGQIHLVHAVAHIEYSAVDLALDICYRFRDLPKEFYDDWLEVADDEIRHFEMLDGILGKLGAKYGDVSVHASLFESSMKTAHSLLHRLAVVPRYLEANGLDATPAILKKLRTLPESLILNDIKSALEVILEEEIAHVRKGDRWFEYACKREGVEKDIYLEIIPLYYPRAFANLKELNKEARLEAGFSCEEMKRMTKKEICSGK